MAALGSPELQPPAAPVSTGADQGEGEGEWGAGSAVGGSLGRERRGGCQASRWRSEKLGGEAFRRGRGEGRNTVRCGVLRGSSGWLL
jgi:hypothetical protein